MGGRATALLKKNHIFRYFIGATSISLLGSHIFDIAIPLYVFERTRSPIALGLVGVGLHLPYFLSAPLTSFIVDYFNKRKVMFLSDLGQIAALVFLLFYTQDPNAGLWPLLLAVFVCKTFMIQFETVTTFHLIPSLVSKDELTDATLWFLSAQRFIQIVGPFVGGALMTALGFRSCILINVISFAATLAFVLKVRDLNNRVNADAVHRPREVSVSAIYANFVEGMRFVWASSLFRPFVFTMLCWNLTSFTPSSATITYYFSGAHAFTPYQYGIVVSVVGVFSIIGFILGNAFYRRASFGFSFIGACLWQAIFASFCLFFLKHPAMLALCFAVSRMGGSVVSMGTFLLRQTEVPRPIIGTVNTVMRMHFMIAAPISALVQGVVIEHVGAGASFALGALCLWGTLFFSRRVASAYENSQSESPHSSVAA